MVPDSIEGPGNIGALDNRMELGYIAAGLCNRHIVDDETAFVVVDSLLYALDPFSRDLSILQLLGFYNF